LPIPDQRPKADLPFLIGSQNTFVRLYLRTVQRVQERPKTIVIVAVFLFAAAAIAIVVGTSLLFPNRLLDRLWELNKPGAALFHRLGWISGVFLLGLGGVAYLGAVNMLRRKQWAWWFATMLFAIDGAGDVISSFLTRDFVKGGSGAVISFAFLYALTRPRVRGYFKQIP
jgi:hypothetical protein